MLTHGDLAKCKEFIVKTVESSVLLATCSPFTYADPRVSSHTCLVFMFAVCLPERGPTVAVGIMGARRHRRLPPGSPEIIGITCALSLFGGNFSAEETHGCSFVRSEHLGC